MENYEYLGTIGVGAYGIVGKARHKASGQIVAIKKFKESDDDERVRKTALREVRILKQLKHENIVELIEVFRRKGKLYLVFEFVDRTLLEDLEAHPDGLDESQVQAVVWQLLRAIGFCHSHNVVHRDIKPENLLMSANGVLKLCDFGFARTLAGPGSRYTDYVSTRWYRSPELLVGDTGYGKAVDMWAVGCLVAEITNGLPLFPGESDVDQLFHIIRCFGALTPRLRDLAVAHPLFAGVTLPEYTELDTLQQKLTHAPGKLVDLIAACLAYEPLQRPTCSELLRHEYFAGFAEAFKPVLAAAQAADAKAKQTRRPSSRHLRSRGGGSRVAAEGGVEAGTGGPSVQPEGGGSAGSGGTRDAPTHPPHEQTPLHEAGGAGGAGPHTPLARTGAQGGHTHPLPTSGPEDEAAEQDVLIRGPSRGGRYASDDLRSTLASRSDVKSEQRELLLSDAALGGRGWAAEATSIRASLTRDLQQRGQQLEAERLRLRSQGGLVRTPSRGGLFNGEGKGRGGVTGGRMRGHNLEASDSLGTLQPLRRTGRALGADSSDEAPGAVSELSGLGGTTRSGSMGGAAGGKADDRVGSMTDPPQPISTTLRSWTLGTEETAARGAPRALPALGGSDTSAGGGGAGSATSGRDSSLEASLFPGGHSSTGGGGGGLHTSGQRLVAVPGLVGVEGESKVGGGGGASEGKGGGWGGEPPSSRHRGNPLAGMHALRPLPSLSETAGEGGGLSLGGTRGGHPGWGGGAGGGDAPGLFLGGVSIAHPLRTRGGGGATPSRGGHSSTPLSRGGVPRSSGMGSGGGGGYRAPGGGGGVPAPGTRWSGAGMAGSRNSRQRSRGMALSGMGMGLTQRSSQRSGGGPSRGGGLGAVRAAQAGAGAWQRSGAGGAQRGLSLRGRSGLALPGHIRMA